MTGSQSRREALRAGVQLSALAAVSLTSPAALGRGTGPRHVPGGTRALSRVVERNLKDGRLLSVSRTWNVRFSATGRGVAINGHQTGVNVDAPAVLAPLAKLERERSTEGMFPILLNSQGKIVAAGEMHDVSEMRRAVSEAEDILGVGYMHQGEAATVSQTLQQLSQASARLIEILPDDLFYPREPYFETRRPIALTDGTVGEFVVRFDCEKDAGTGLLSRAERRITTRIGSQERFSREVWTLS